MAIVADRRLLYESKTWPKPIERQGKEEQKLVLKCIIFQPVHPFDLS